MNFNAGPSLLECVASLRREQVSEVVVVDNSSIDGSPAALARADPGADLVAAGGNLGYGAAVNLGAGRTASEFLLVCNPDTSLEPGALAALESRLVHDPSLAVVGPALVAPDGASSRSGGAFPTVRGSLLPAALGVLSPRGRYSTRHRAANAARTESGVVDWVTGACMLIRRCAFDEVSGFDPGYFMYVEEVDLCWRLAQRGWRTGYEPRARVVHLAGLSAGTRPYRMLVAHHRSLWRFARRSARGPEVVLLPAVAVGVVLRWAVASARRAVLGRS